MQTKNSEKILQHLITEFYVYLVEDFDDYEKILQNHLALIKRINKKYGVTVKECPEEFKKEYIVSRKKFINAINNIGEDLIIVGIYKERISSLIEFVKSQKSCQHDMLLGHMESTETCIRKYKYRYHTNSYVMFIETILESKKCFINICDELIKIKRLKIKKS